MRYDGIIKRSRTFDSIALAGTIDVIAASLILYSPEQLGLTVPVYFGIRVALGALQVWLRKDTTGPVRQ